MTIVIDNRKTYINFESFNVNNLIFNETLLINTRKPFFQWKRLLCFDNYNKALVTLCTVKIPMPDHYKHYINVKETTKVIRLYNQQIWSPIDINVNNLKTIDFSCKENVYNTDKSLLIKSEKEFEKYKKQMVIKDIIE
jgi:hypothetical protein